MNQIDLKLRSRKLMQKAEIGILVPTPDIGKNPAESYDGHKPWRVLWLLHGATCDYEDFLYHDRIVPMLEGHDIMTVMPNGLNSDYANHMEFANGYPYTDFFFDELMPYIYANFNVSDKPEDNFLAGYSMGGAGALMLGIYRPERFGKVAVLGSSVRESAFLQPYLDWTGEQFKKAALADPKKFPTEFGNPAEGITRKEINMIGRYDTVRDYVSSMECTWERYADAVKSRKLPQILFCSGDQDGCCKKVREFQVYADSLGKNDIQYEVIPGFGHDRGDVTIKRALEWMEI